jgi:hypothetical protein
MDMTVGPIDEAPPFRTVIDMAVAAADLSRLLSLDVTWTEAESREGGVGDDDRDSLIGLGSLIADQLSSAEQHAQLLEEVFTSYAPWVNARVVSTLDSDRFTQGQRDDIRRILAPTEDDFAARGAASARAFRQVAATERDDLTMKIDRLRRGGAVATDLSHSAACGIAGSALVAEIVLCPETAGLGCAAALVIYLEMEIAHC